MHRSVRALLPRNRHFCHFGAVGAAGELGPFVSQNPSLLSAAGGCWGAGGALCFSEPVTFVTFGAAGRCCWGGPLFLRTRHFCHFWCCWGLLGSWGAEPVTFVTFGGWGPFVSQNPSLLSLLEAAGGALSFSEPVTFITFGAAGGCWPFVSQNPSLLSLLGAAGGALSFSEPVTFITFGAAGGCWGAGGGPLFLRTRHFCHFWCWGGCWGAGALFLRTRHFCHFGLMSIGFGCR